MAIWKNEQQLKKIETVHGRRHWYFELVGYEVEPGDGEGIRLSELSIPWLVTLTYFSASADGIVTLQPTISRILGADATTLQRELTEETARIKIHNQQPACLVLEGNNLWIEPNVSSGPVNVWINLVIAEGHDLRGQ